MNCIPQSEFRELRHKAGLSLPETAIITGISEQAARHYDEEPNLVALPPRVVLEALRRAAHIGVKGAPPLQTDTTFAIEHARAVGSTARRYGEVATEKSTGATYTPPVLAEFVADRMMVAANLAGMGPIRLLDPAVGDGELLVSLLGKMKGRREVDVFGFDTDPAALAAAQRRITELCPDARVCLKQMDFLDYALDHAESESSQPLFGDTPCQRFDLIISNPPYVRTQILGSEDARRLARKFGLAGRVDLYHAFLAAIARLLRPDGTAGIIVSNRFMTTKGGASVRSLLREKMALRHIWDLGDTKLFEAAVLPAVIIANGKGRAGTPRFSSIYETEQDGSARATNPIEALAQDGIIRLSDGRRFRVQHGELAKSDQHDGVWRIATTSGEAWLGSVRAKTWRQFGDIGKIRVGVKTCADKVFIRRDWSALPPSEMPELLRPLTTHHCARRYKASTPAMPRHILYPHEVVNGVRRATGLQAYPKSRIYLEGHRKALEERSYVIAAGRNWYEIWVPQDPASWSRPKLVFRDISERPTFWIDLDGTVVNGDCYWLVADSNSDELLWLAAGVANSSFAEAFYDRKFNNKLYAGRRRFITQYVEQFPIPDLDDQISKDIVGLVKLAYDAAGTERAGTLEMEINRCVWAAFGLREEISR